MASSILSAVGKMVFVAGAEKLRDEIEHRKYGSATQTIEVILAAQKESFDKVNAKMEQVVGQNELDKEAIQIEKWADDLKERLRKAEKGEEGPLKKLYDDLNDTDDGIHRRMITINALLTGSATKYSNAGLIQHYLDKVYSNLESHDQMNYTINNYLIDVAKYLEHQFKLQETALALRLAAASPTDPTDSWKQKMTEVRQGQIKYAWDRFPHMIRKMKSDFGGAMDPIHWWRFRADGGKVLTRPINNFLWSSNYRYYLEDSDEGPCPGTEFRFQPSLDSDGLIRIQIRSDKDRYLAGTYTTGSGFQASVGNWSQALYNWNSAAVAKIVPKKGPDGEPKFRIVTENKNLRNVYPFNKDWGLYDEGVGQWD